jgi:hypothetical protein
MIFRFDSFTVLFSMSKRGSVLFRLPLCLSFRLGVSFCLAIVLLPMRHFTCVTPWWERQGCFVYCFVLLCVFFLEKWCVTFCHKRPPYGIKLCCEVHPCASSKTMNKHTSSCVFPQLNPLLYTQFRHLPPLVTTLVAPGAPPSPLDRDSEPSLATLMFAPRSRFVFRFVFDVFSAVGLRSTCNFASSRQLAVALFCFSFCFLTRVETCVV